MANVQAILRRMKLSPQDIRFSDLCLVCDRYVGKARQSKTSHRVYKTPWPGDPRVNIQDSRGKAKAHQVKQVLLAIERLEVAHGTQR